VDRERLTQLLRGRAQPSYRAPQIWEWVARGASGYEEMTNLPGELRSLLARELPLSTLELIEESKADDGTVKALFRTHDGHPVEAVLMRFRDGRRSICLSSQSGCPLVCTFCATGSMRFYRNLTADEILDQALHFRRLAPLSHAVFMGMGEPMLNLDAVLAACQRLPDLGITARRTTVSTVGWLPGIPRFTAEPSRLRLALSLHAPNDELRDELVPSNERYPLRDVLAACRADVAARKQKVFIEYVMLAGVNDTDEQARELGTLLDRKAFKINLIPYNPTGSYAGSAPERIDAFQTILRRAGLATTIRLTRGRTIDAACGQLAALVARPDEATRQATPRG
jgi:23S rRNA (adenine2503-C2)-methyltransferase